MKLFPVPAAVVLTCVLAGCAVGPAYERPASAAPAAWKEASTAAGWLPAAPADALERGDWWTLFGDDTLNRLAARVQVSNQNVAAAVANYAQAQALVKEKRAALFPSASLGVGAQRTGGEGASRSGTATNASLGVSWDADVWGRLGQLSDSAQANAQASEADLAAARLSAVAALVSDYFQLRAADTDIGLLESTVQSYERSLQIVRNRYAAGTAAQTDVLQAQTQWDSARADLSSARADRTKLEHAIAVLTGSAPSDFTLEPAVWSQELPAVPIGVPSTLLQRRPDIAKAERAVASAHAQIGVERAGYFPSLTLSASVGSNGSTVSDLLRAPNSLWSLGLSLAQVVFDAGATSARVEGAQAGVDAALAQYRQTVLAAFQSVEDQLSQIHTLTEQEGLRRSASAAADQSEQQMLNRYRAGQVSYSDVVTAQVTALNARRALLQLQLNRQEAVVALVQALGGGWHAPWLEVSEAAQAKGG